VNAVAGMRGGPASALLRWLGAAFTSAAEWLEARPLRAERLDAPEIASAHERLSEMRARYY
jgi:hypothetical protein